MQDLSASRAQAIAEDLSASRAQAIAEEARLQREREQEEIAIRLEEERKVAEAEEEKRKAEDEERRLQAIQEAEEKARLEREAAESEKAAAEQERIREEQERLHQARLEKERQDREKAIATFLKQNGFTAGVNGAKKSFMSSSYPLHKAAESGDVKIVTMLLREGADPSQKNSSGKTALEVAKKKDNKGSHSKVVTTLSTAQTKTSTVQTARRVGGA